jgi:hypothetical protein
MTSLRLPAGTLLFLPACWIAGLALLTGCATKRAPEPGPLVLAVPQTLRGPCPRPSRPRSPSVGELAGFSVEQEAAISTCEGRKDAAVQMIDAHNAAALKLAETAKPKRVWWRLWR